MGKLYAVGFGPGGYEHMTAKAIDVIKNADVITGYTTYVEMLKKFFPDKEYVATPMTKEMDRCRMAVDLAAEGKTVAMVSSGDSGIYGMAGILLEIANEKKADCSTIEEALHADELGFDFIGTTMVGYTKQSEGDKIEENDFEILREIVSKVNHKVIAEGNINTPEKARRVLELGAYSVVVGSIITRPQLITKSFVEAIEK